MTPQDLQEKYMEFKVVQEQIEKISQHVEYLNTQFSEIESSKEALEELAKTAIGSELLAPVANGIFLKTKLASTQNLLVNVGADTIVEKTIPQVLELLEAQSSQITQKIAEVEQFLQELNAHALKMYQSLQEEQGAEE